jgi:FixJ family two-component response regulator
MRRGEAIVFVVDDDESLRTSTARLVRASGFQVETFASAREFLDHTRPDAPARLCSTLRLRVRAAWISSGSSAARPWGFRSFS